MTECISGNRFFQGPKSRKTEFNFNGGDISSDGGLLFVKEFDRKFGLTRRVGKLPDSFDIRQPGKVEHSCLSMLRPRVLGLVAVHEDLKGHHELRNDPLIQTVVGRDRQLATPSALCRFADGINRRACADLSRLLVEFFIESFATALQELILDSDAADDLTYGMQENRFFHGLYDRYRFLPLYVFCVANPLQQLSLSPVPNLEFNRYSPVTVILTIQNGLLERSRKIRFDRGRLILPPISRRL